MSELESKAPQTGDLISGAVLIALGSFVLVLAFRMPNFAERGVNPLTAPGIFPAVVGAALILCGAILAIRSAGKRRNAAKATIGSGTGRILGCLALMLICVALVGRIDFMLLSGGFTVAFAAFFLDWRTDGQLPFGKLAAVGLTGLITAFAIPMLFEHVFLVRLP